MGYISKTTLPSYDDDEFIKILKRGRKAKAKDYNGGFGEEYFHQRHFMPSYLKQLIKSKSTKITQEAVYKRISQGVGKNALSNLLQYISRTTQDQIKLGEQKTQIYNEMGVALNNEQIENIKAEWMEDFASKSFQDKYPEKANTLINFHNEVQMLTIKENSGKITQVEQDQLALYRAEGLKKNIWEYGTTIGLKDGTQGKIHKKEKNGKIVVEFESGDQKYKTLDKSDINPLLTKEGFKISKVDTGGKKLSLDDPNYQVATPDFATARKSLPKDFEHFILSVGGENPDKKKSFEATQEFLEENLHRRGFRYVFAEHDDGDHLHYHVVAHRTNIRNHKLKFPTGMHDSFIFRKEYCDTLSEKGIDRTITLRRDRANMVELQREKAEKALNSSRRFKSQKRNPEAGNLFADYYTLNTYLDMVQEKMEDMDIKKKEKKEIIHLLDISRVSIKLDGEEAFKNAVNGFTKSLSQKSEEMGEFWSKTMTPEKIKSFETNYMAAYRDQKAIEAQDKQTNKFIQSWQGLNLVKKENSKEEQMVNELDKLIHETEKMIFKSEKISAYAKKIEPRLRNRQDIEKYLELEPELRIGDGDAKL